MPGLNFTKLQYLNFIRESKHGTAAVKKMYLLGLLQNKRTTGESFDTIREKKTWDEN